MQGVRGVSSDGCQPGQHPSVCHLLDGVPAVAQDRDSSLNQLVKSLSLSVCAAFPPPQPPSPTHDGIKHCWGHCSVTGPDKNPANTEGAQSPQQVQVTLALPVQGVSVVGPVQFLAEMNTWVSEWVHHLNVPTLDVHRLVGCECPMEAYQHVFCFTDVMEKMGGWMDRKIDEDPQLGNSSLQNCRKGGFPHTMSQSQQRCPYPSMCYWYFWRP